jgi:hypothetical protein
VRLRFLTIKTGPVILSVAKDLPIERDPSLRVTSEGGGDWAVFPVLVVKTHYRAVVEGSRVARYRERRALPSRVEIEM